MLAQLNEPLPKVSGEARHEAELTNLPMIVQHSQTFGTGAPTGGAGSRI